METRFGLLPEGVQIELARANPERLRRIAVACASLALKEARLQDATFDRAIDQLRLGEVDSDRAVEVKERAEQLDDQYFAMVDEAKPGGRTSGWEVAFRTARAAASVEAAFLLDARAAAINAAYEAVHALEPGREERVAMAVATTR